MVPKFFVPTDVPHLHWGYRPASEPPAGIKLREKIFTRIAGTQGTEPVEWIWPGWIPRGKLTLMVGYPGVGKSYLALDVLARFTARIPWPVPREADAPAPPDLPSTAPELPPFLDHADRRVVLISGEDHPDDTISWRFASARGDLGRLAIVESVGATASLREDPGAEFSHRFSLERDLHHLHSILMDWKTIELVVIDPIVMHCDEAESETHLRKVLSELTRLTLQWDVAVLAIAHLRHDPAKTDIYKALGSRALAAIPRTIMTVQTDPADPKRRLVLPLKMNLGPPPSGLAFRFGPDRILWEGEAIDRIASDPPVAHDPSRTMVDEAVEFLKQMLADGDVPATDVFTRGAKQGFRPRTLYRAKALIKAGSYRKGFGAESNFYWTKDRSSPSENDSKR